MNLQLFTPKETTINKGKNPIYIFLDTGLHVFLKPIYKMKQN